MLTHCAVALAHVLAVAAPVATNPPAAPGTGRATSPSEAERSEQAKKLYAEQRYIESAHAYESLYGEFKAPKYLFNAAAAREAAGHDAHAYVLFRRYLETPGLSADDHERGEARMAPLRRRTTVIQLQFSPSPRPAGLTVTMTRDGVEPLQLDEEALQALDRRGVVEVWAEVGQWSVQAQAPGFRAAKSAVQATPGATRALPLELAAAAGAEIPVQATNGSLTVQIQGRRIPRDLLLRFRRGNEIIERSSQAAESTWELPIGGWSVHAEGRDLTTDSESVQVVRGVPQQLSLSLQRTRASRLKLGVGGALAGTLGVVGVAFAIVESKNFPGPCYCDTSGYERDFEKIQASYVPRAIAGSALGLSLGFGLGTLLMNTRRPVPRVSLGLGAGLTIAAAVAAVVLASMKRIEVTSFEEFRVEKNREQQGVAAIVGLSSFGVGMMTSTFLFAKKGDLRMRTRSANR